MPEYLDPEIANEGELAILPGDEGWQVPMEKPHIPDYSWLKPTDRLAKYFPAISGIPYKHKAFPAWLYHPTEKPKLVHDIFNRDDPPRLLKSAEQQAKELGVEWRKSTSDEIAQGFPPFRWVFQPNSWRPTPYHAGPNANASGKTAPAPSQSETIAAAVAAAMRGIGGGVSSGQQVSDIAAAVAAAVAGALKPGEAAPVVNALHSEEPLDKDALIETAKGRGIKVDGRWSIDRIQDELNKVA